MLAQYSFANPPEQTGLVGDAKRLVQLPTGMHSMCAVRYRGTNAIEITAISIVVILVVFIAVAIMTVAILAQS